MSASQAEVRHAAHQKELRQALIVHCRLSSQQVERVDEAVKAMHMDFPQAAVHTGIVTQREMEQAVDFVNATAAERGSGVIETALYLRKQEHKQLITRPSEQVTPSKELGILVDPYGSRSERLRTLRTELLMLDDTTGHCNLLCLISPCAQEGRSLLAAELAIAFSQLGSRTLLIDADLRNPRQHQLFGYDNKWGLTRALGAQGKIPLLGVEGVPHLNLLTAGPTAPNPLELLSDGRFERLISNWRHEFDEIVIDTPPVSMYADGLAVATTTGRALVLSRAATTPRKDMKDMMRRLIATQARIMGAVLSEFPTPRRKATSRRD